jgi:tetratricopeptide (TPR) repeat protein
MYRNLLVTTLCLAATLRVAAAQTPTFSRDVAPIFLKNCVTCHHPGDNSPFSLQTYAEARPWARAIRERVITRQMPPWKPEAGYGDPFQAARGLKEQEIDTIDRWVSGGAPEGNPSDLPEGPNWPGDWRLGTPDLVIRMPDPYELRASGPDVFRNFVLPIPTTGVRYVKAVEFIAGTHAVHHANLRIDETTASRQRDAEDPLPGYDGLMAASAIYPEGYFLGWTPGQLPPMSPELAWRLNPGSDMVVQLHLRPTGRVEQIQVSIGLYFTSAPPRLTPTMLRLGKQYIDIPPGAKEYAVTDSYVLPVDVDVYAVQPHAHYRARKIEGFATLADGKTKGLIRIPDWDFDWQDTYRYVKPFALPKGTTLTMRYTYDNSSSNPRNPQLPPQPVHWGQNSTDEMGDLWIQVVAHSEADTARLVREFRQKVFQEDILGYESVLRVTPDDVALHDDIALLYLAVGRISDAIAHFSESTRLAPNVAAAHFNLGIALTGAGKLDDAIAQYRRALELKPGYASAHNNLGSVLLARGNLEESAVHFRRAIEIDPTQADAHNNLGKLLAFQGRAEEALDHLRRALEIRPEYPDAHYNLARALLAQGQASEAADHYRAALNLRPDWAPVLAEAAWLFATHPDARVRDPVLAISFAERGTALTNRRDPVLLDVLAAAYAASGSFEKAVAAARAAQYLIPAKSAMEQRLALYQQGRAYVDVHGSGPITRTNF